MNLQLFAQEKTEKATPRRRQKARERGQVFSSRELTSALILLTGFILLRVFGFSIIQNLADFLKDILINYLNREDLYSTSEIYTILYRSVLFVGKAVVPLVTGVVFVGVLSNYLQVGFVLSFEPIAPKLERMNPFEGMKRIFSKRSILELIKSTVKILIVSFMVYSTIKSKKDLFPLMLDMDIFSAFLMVSNLAFEVGIKAAIILLVLSVFDYFYQRYEYETGLMMSKEDIKEEFKEIEGNPQIKSRVRQIQRQMARGRMMKDVKKADVVITNPTHYAVALAYDSGINAAPVVLAKGSDKLAQKIKEIAEQENIPIVENKTLAQILYRSVEVGEMIPEHLYNAVAEILAFVYSLKERRP